MGVEVASHKKDALERYAAYLITDERRPFSAKTIKFSSIML